MPRTRECDFCGSDIEPGTGTMLVLNDGTTHHFCSGKCEKNVDLGREARDLEWTESGGGAGRRAAAEATATEEADEEEPEADADADTDADEEDSEEADADADEGDEADDSEDDEE